MFIDQEWKKEKKEIPDIIEDSDSGPIYKNPYFLVGLTIFVSFILIIVIILSYLYKPHIPSYRPPARVDNPGTESVVSTSSLTGLPSDDSNGDGSGAKVLNFDELQGEYLHFGQFYKPFATAFDNNLPGYTLPINVKTEVVNYHDLSRKIDLSDAIDDLNKNGFSFLSPQLNSGDSDFYSMQRRLEGLGVPLFVSTDMVWYYHQNSLKSVFKEIEKNVFYEYVWDINKRLYDISLTRYRKKLSELGQVNDVILEAQRLETAFLATALALLKPKNDQIIWDKNFVDKNLFSAQESDYFFFNMPPDIARDVERELGNISVAKNTRKSSIMLYDIDYSRFAVPDNYINNAKLKNYFLATQWLRNSFPLFYQDENCPDCLLDYDDWLINFVAAHYLAKDMDDNQSLKNKWAVVYKFIAFFEGLRSELTYLHYNQVLEKLNLKEQDLAEVFDKDKTSLGSVFSDLQSELSQIYFLPIEGGVSRDQDELRRDIGMRILQTHFWPDRYIFNELQGEDMLVSGLVDQKNRVTFCGSNIGAGYRCSVMGADILSVLDYRPVADNYFDVNIRYSGYEEKISMIEEQLEQFNAANWNSNFYWMNIDVARSKIDFSQDKIFQSSLSAKWKEKDQNTILGAWVNMNLPNEEFSNYEGENRAGLGKFLSCDHNSYIEPNLFFYRDLLARGNMLHDIITVLPVGKKTNVAAIAVKEVNTKIAEIVRITEKQLRNEEMSDDECIFISEFATGLEVKDGSDRRFTIVSKKGKNIAKSIEGTKLIIFVYERGGQKRAAVGPIYNYKEGFK